MRNLARGIRSDACWPAMSHQHFVDVGGCDAGALQCRGHGDGAQFRRMDVLECAPKPADWRPRGAQNDNVPNWQRVPIISNDCSN